MRHYASVMYAVVMCPSVCLSVCHKLVMCGKWWDESSGILAPRLSYTYHTLYLKKFGYLQVLPPETLSQRLDIENFTTASRLCCQQNSLTVKLVSHTYDNCNSCGTMFLVLWQTAHHGEFRICQQARCDIAIHVPDVSVDDIQPTLLCRH